MENDVAIFLDLDNIVIGAIEANLTFDINLILDEIWSKTNGRIVLRRAYGDWRQRENLTKELATAGFELQSTVRLNSMSKNLADMQMVVDAMGTLIDGQSFTTYVLITGDRDFVPLVQGLRKRGKQVIGMGVRHTSSGSLVNLCDDYIYYDDLASTAQKMVEEQVTELLQRAIDQLLQDETNVPASLLKQRMQALSKGAFNRSPQGKGSFSKFLNGYPDIVDTYLDETTLYVCRPSETTAGEKAAAPQPLSTDGIKNLLEKALGELVSGKEKVRASLLKQRMQKLSDGAFNENSQGIKSFRKFLESHDQIVCVEQEGTTLYVRQANDMPSEEIVERLQPVSVDTAEKLLEKALDRLVTEEQTRVRASLLKQEMQELSQQSFDETVLGFENFRDFLTHFPKTAAVQQKGTTLYVFPPEQESEPVELHLQYRSELKKRGLRIVPSDIRLCVIRDMISTLQRNSEISWRKLVNTLTEYYQSQGKENYSKSYVNDVLRAAKRADVVGILNGGKLSTSPIYLKMSGDRLFQDAVMRFDLTYLQEIQLLDNCAFDLEEAAVALYESVGHTRYLKVVLSHFANNGQISQAQ
ncbi:MAG: NYN domain-containing protein [Candidatus Promineifilaceae bacterium]